MAVPYAVLSASMRISPSSMTDPNEVERVAALMLLRKLSASPTA
ncbi:hypothetical protein CBA19CS11_11820 [Caballeronia novacaledonica]|uniref:Uncharacterized protein n=1 Tax=Caballeronia novacaledonica TaxID=1544861 RepID=A0AA37I8M5_9BURK|nr:hypothetical protein [Caballeronia novacaledonica]GJH09524.1 hypothetical protein CBA19CS11_11820 [Caballeronia novacaledonica]GJH24502.1 hypothetical protein CBA19CS42_08320 [Caballeronia novacaledonica]